MPERHQRRYRTLGVELYIRDGSENSMSDLNAISVTGGPDIRWIGVRASDLRLAKCRIRPEESQGIAGKQDASRSPAGEHARYAQPILTSNGDQVSRWYGILGGAQ
jgi:hypothetical protein